MMQQRTEEWLQWRRGKIGASDAATIMGVSPWSTPHKLWLEKKGRVEDAEPSFYMQRGNDLEEEARVCFERMTGLTIFPEIKQHEKHSWMVASLDGIDFTGKVVVEIKCPGAKAHAIAGTGKVPPIYIPQLQHQMEVCGVDEMYYFSYNGSDGVILKVERDQEYIDKMLVAELKFWETMQLDEYPTVKHSDLANVIASRYKACKEEIKALEREEKMLKESLITYCDGVDCEIGDVKISKCTRMGSVDYAAIPELNGIDLEKYRKPGSESWSIRIKGEN
jgi:putative phage-type endonuclease